MSSFSTPAQMAPTLSFFLYRAPTSGDSFDPTAAIQFWPAKDSDELFDALRLAYPGVKTHSERMRNAVIDFLMKERDDEQAKNQPDSTPSTWSSWPSLSASASTLSSPDLIDLATPASTTSPMPSMSRQPSRSSAGRSSMEQMTGVFSLSTTSQPKTCTRRKMTSAEKAEYRKRRIVKACDQCSKRKRKCHHNQAQMDTLAPSSTKISKKTSPPSSAAPPRQAAETSFLDSTFDIESASSFDKDSFFSMDNAQGATGTDATLGLMDFGFEQQSSGMMWPWSDTQDWTLMDSQPLYGAAQLEPLFGDASICIRQPQPPHDVPWENHSIDTEQQQRANFTRHALPASHNSGGSGGSLSFVDLPGFLQEGLAPHNIQILSPDTGNGLGGPEYRTRLHHENLTGEAALVDLQSAPVAVEPGRTLQEARVQQESSPRSGFGIGDRTTNATMKTPEAIQPLVEVSYHRRQDSRGTGLGVSGRTLASSEVCNDYTDRTDHDPTQQETRHNVQAATTSSRVHTDNVVADTRSLQQDGTRAEERTSMWRMRLSYVLEQR